MLLPSSHSSRPVSLPLPHRFGLQLWPSVAHVMPGAATHEFVRHPSQPSHSSVPSLTPLPHFWQMSALWYEPAHGVVHV